MAFKKIPINLLPTALPERINVFICSTSFEQRSTMIPAGLDRNRVDHAIVCANRVTFTSLIDETAKKLCEMFAERASLAEISMDNPLIIADRLRQEIRKLPEYPATTYAIDASANWPKRTIASNRRRVVTRIPPPPENNLKARLHSSYVQACVRKLCQIVVDVTAAALCLPDSRPISRPRSFPVCP